MQKCFLLYNGDEFSNILHKIHLHKRHRQFLSYRDIENKFHRMCSLPQCSCRLFLKKIKEHELHEYLLNVWIYYRDILQNYKVRTCSCDVSPGKNKQRVKSRCDKALSPILERDNGGHCVFARSETKQQETISCHPLWNEAETRGTNLSEKILWDIKTRTNLISWEMLHMYNCQVRIESSSSGDSTLPW